MSELSVKSKIPYMGSISDWAQSGLRSTKKGRRDSKKKKYKDYDEFFKPNYYDDFFDSP